MAHESAKVKAKKAFDSRCVFRGTTGVDGMHVYPASLFPQLSDCEYNIFPGSRDLHSGREYCFDLHDFGTRLVSERIWILMNLSLIEFRSIIRRRLQQLELTCKERNIVWPEPVEPGDLNELLCGFKVGRKREYEMAGVGIQEVGEVSRDL